MSKTRDVELLILTHFADDKEHSVAEFRQEAIRLGLIPEQDYSAVYNALFRLKEDPRVKAVSKGVYVITSADGITDALYSIETNIDYFASIDLSTVTEEQYQDYMQQLFKIRRSLTIDLKKLELIILENSKNRG